jgi:Holliday junction resolvase
MTPSKKTENKSPFNDVNFAHQVIEAIGKVDNKIEDEQAFVNRLRHVEYGLNAETECSAILAWLGNCSIVHKISAEGYFPENMKVPDLFAVFEKNRQILRTCVEVKSTEDLKLRWTNEYYGKLQNYSNIMGHPLLLSWKVRPFGRWILLDPATPGLVKEERIDFRDSLSQNLMGIIAGDFTVFPKSGIGIHFDGKILKKEKISKTESNVNIKISGCFWGDSKRNKLRNLSQSEIALIMMLANNQYYNEKGQTVKWGYITPDIHSQEQNNVFAQDLLRFLVGFSKKDNERIAWRNVLQELNDIISRDDLLTELSSNIGSTVQCIFHQNPKTKSSLLDEEWYKGNRLNKT